MNKSFTLIKDIVFISFFCIGLFLLVTEKYGWVLLWIIIFAMWSIYTLVSDRNRWSKNSKLLKGEKIKFRKTSNVFLLFFILGNVWLLISDYNRRASYFSVIEKRNIQINNFMDYLQSFNGFEKLGKYVILIAIISFIILVIHDIILNQLATKSGIIFCNGEFACSSEVKKVEVEESFFEVSKKITIYTEDKARILYLKKEKYEDFKKMINMYYATDIIENN